ncbi:unnamed protein product [Larinioides sclopetarius]|uniref:Thiamine transporter SLC35F3 n=1 Tax=Larinioides sclopetarius TaxID=280406 RepID=A0AAV1ZZI5_9ARAC
MTAGVCNSMSNDEGKAHTRILRLPTVDNTPVKHLNPPAVVITADDSDTMMESPRRIPVSKSLVFSDKSRTRTEVADFRALSAKKANGSIPARQESSENSSPEGVQLGLSPTTPHDQQPGDAMLEHRENQRESQPYVQVTRRTCFTEHRKRMSCGLFLTSFVAVSWVGGTHLLRAMYIDYSLALVANAQKLNMTSMSNLEHGEDRSALLYPLYNAPFFTTWVCTTLNFFFFPVYLTSRFCAPASEKTSMKKELTDSIQPYQERGLSVGGFLCRCGTFTVLWVATNYMFVYSLTLLDATDVIALYTTNVAFIYLLSWVLLQEQFVGIRIVAVIMCNTGIALFAYMDGGVSRAMTLGGVVLAAAAAAGTAVYKVLFKKFIGEVNLGQLSFFFSSVGLCNILMMWPIFLALYFTDLETIFWKDIPWLPLGGAALFIFCGKFIRKFWSDVDL